MLLRVRDQVQGKHPEEYKEGKEMLLGDRHPDSDSNSDSSKDGGHGPSERRRRRLCPRGGSGTVVTEAARVRPAAADW